MSETATTLLEQLLKLSEADRVLIAESLWASLSDEAQHGLLAAPPEDPEFGAEITRRSDSLHDGTAELYDAAEVFAEVRERLRQKRGQ